MRTSQAKDLAADQTNNMEKQTTRARLIDICIVKTTRKAIRRTARPYQFLHEPTLDKQASSCQSEEEEKATLTRVKVSASNPVSNAEEQKDFPRNPPHSTSKEYWMKQMAHTMSQPRPPLPTFTGTG